jgi:hypothetical protein
MIDFANAERVEWQKRNALCQADYGEEFPQFCGRPCP